ncbi:glycosyltransferase family 39 protein [Candidatus Borrarchaeum sp.]|uniref:ArnT family glycosyltransferase n=1 Tax=Candidatus Borrarchaeum sp. TaxID=2846742 RepID=UPI00257A43D8|nr:glycosyltransferase family 39 protein [Candidatus Borrarchaeum sp.]
MENSITSIQKMLTKLPIKLSIYDLLALVITLFSFALRIFFLQFTFAINPDGIYYCWSARHLLEGKGYTIGSGDIPAIRAPIYPLFVALFFLVFGVNHISAKLVSIVFGSLSVFILYALVKLNFKNERTGLFSALIFAINPFFIVGTDFYLGGVYREGFSTFIFLLAILFTIKAKNERKYTNFLIMGLLSGIFYLVRPEGLYLLIFQVFYFCLLFVDQRQLGLIKKIGITISVTIFVILPWLIRDYLTFGVFNRESYYHGAFFFLREFGTQIPTMMLSPLDYLFSYHSLTQIAIGLFVGFYRLWLQLSAGLTPLGFFLFAFGFILTIKRRYLFFHLLLIFYLLSYSWPSYVWPSIVPRYLTVLIPICLLFAGRGLSELEQLLSRVYQKTIVVFQIRLTSKQFQQIIILGVLLIITVNSLLLAKDIIIDEQYKPQIEAFERTGEWLQQNTASNSVIYTNFPTLIERYSERTALDLKKTTIQEILKMSNANPVYIVVDSSCVQSDELIEMYLYATQHSVVWYDLTIPENVDCVFTLGSGSWHPYDIAVYKKVTFN